ncbi:MULTISPECIES: hypothetical protein [unclassified Microbacterium]|uniref:FMN-binding protein n=1 Tax=unclassified Microbacterium TaxID=2609290 RepID=UPI00386D420A
MIRTTAVPRPLRVSAAVASVAGLAFLAGCSTQPTAPASSAPADSGSSESTQSGAGGDATGGTYTDGTYTAEGSYQTPESVEEISVTLTLESDVITDVVVEGQPSRAESEQYQSQFIGGIRDEVVGKNIDEISVDRVAGSSLTSGGFNQALEEIRTDAAA